LRDPGVIERVVRFLIQEEAGKCGDWKQAPKRTEAPVGRNLGASEAGL
jgi:hypothetical protein